MYAALSPKVTWSLLSPKAPETFEWSYRISGRRSMFSQARMLSVAVPLLSLLRRLPGNGAVKGAADVRAPIVVPLVAVDRLRDECVLLLDRHLPPGDELQILGGVLQHFGIRQTQLSGAPLVEDGEHGEDGEG